MPDRNREISSASESVHQSVGAPLRVLVVEDDPDTVRSLMLLIRTEGHEVSGVGSAKGMWHAIRSQEPDVVILDINLPDASGYQLARDLRRHFGEEAEKPLLIAVTAWNKGSDKLLAQIAGFDYHLGKPYNPNQLLTILRSQGNARGLRGGPNRPL
jgi:DNA-binding response OmpR family regulator